jgi:hypothetical protein
MQANNDSKQITTRVRGMKNSLKRATMKTMVNYNVVSFATKDSRHKCKTFKTRRGRRRGKCCCSAKVGTPRQNLTIY